NLALNIGGGVKYALIPRVGIRSDVRYIRAFVGAGSDDAYDKDYGFLRMALGVTFGLTRPD
ncbi:MAG: hypothetical protein ACREMA_15395, partial [Longimicrobiales bacterium]